VERLVSQTKSLSLQVRETDRWQIFTFSGDEVPNGEDLIAVLEGLKQAAENTTTPIAFDVAGLSRPNSRMLSAVIGLLTGKNEKPRRLALIAPSQTWLDMLDILGVRSSFLIVDSVEEITFEE
jgi:hypothetical protein